MEVIRKLGEVEPNRTLYHRKALFAFVRCGILTRLNNYYSVGVTLAGLIIKTLIRCVGQYVC